MGKEKEILDYTYEFLVDLMKAHPNSFNEHDIPAVIGYYKLGLLENELMRET